MNKGKVAFFDFCETLANFQTADAYVKYVRQESCKRSMQLKETIRLFLLRIKIVTFLSFIFRKASINKRLVLWQLKGFSREELDDYAKKYYCDIIKPNLITPVIKELKSLQNDGWRIVVASAGYEIYLKHFCKEYGINQNDLIAVNIKFKREKCMGSFDGGDRLWDKTKKLDSLFKKEEIKSVAYSDSISDLPLLQWANEGVVIRRTDKKDWASNFNFREIIW